MSFYDVLRRFRLLSGLEGEELSRYSDLCKDALNEVKLKLKVAENALDDGKKLRLAYTAGALAFYRYCLYTSVTEPESFEAGEVRVTRSHDKTEAARRIYEEEYRGLSDVLADSGFSFKGVRA